LIIVILRIDEFIHSLFFWHHPRIIITGEEYYKLIIN
jgi:hypothetical protein